MMPGVSLQLCKRQDESKKEINIKTVSRGALLDPQRYLDEIPEETTWASLLLWKWPVRVKEYGVGRCQNKGPLPWESPLGPFEIKAQSRTREIRILISSIKGIPGVWRHLCSRCEIKNADSMCCCQWRCKKEKHKHKPIQSSHWTCLHVLSFQSLFPTEHITYISTTREQPRAQRTPSVNHEVKHESIITTI